jgi:hypothetical protein
LYWTKGSLPEERELYKKEGDILKEVHRWGLHVSNDVGRLSVLNQLAALQHYGAPTRMIDITFNPWIAAWFAVEKKWDSGGNELYKDKDARLFAIDVTITESTKMATRKHVYVRISAWKRQMHAVCRQMVRRH